MVGPNSSGCWKQLGIFFSTVNPSPCPLGGHWWPLSSLGGQAFSGLAEHTELQFLSNSRDMIWEAEVDIQVEVARFLTA